MPASASLSIAAVADLVGEVELPDPVVLAARLADALARAHRRSDTGCTRPPQKETK